MLTIWYAYQDSIEIRYLRHKKDRKKWFLYDLHDAISVDFYCESHYQKWASNRLKTLTFVKHDLKGSVEVYRVENYTHYPAPPHRPWPTHEVRLI
jgi:hypothetical protein